MPWNLPSDRKRFHEITRGHYVIMGRKTFESIGHPLPDRKNIVLTRQRNYTAAGCIIAHDLGSAFAACGDAADEVFVCGGGEVFQETIALADRIYLTIVHAAVDGDTRFPDIPSDFKEVERKEVLESIPYAAVLFERKDRRHRGL